MFLSSCGRGNIPRAIFSQSRFLHCTSRVSESRKVVAARRAKKRNTARREERMKEILSQKPHPVTGLKPDEGHQWQNCSLARIIVTPQQVLEASKAAISAGHTQPDLPQVPPHTAWGVSTKEKALLFDKLPKLSFAAGQAAQLAKTPTSNLNAQAKLEMAMSERQVAEREKVSHLYRLLDLRNADAGGIHLENRRRIILEFSGPEKPFDTGRPEVQAALLTYKIRNLWDHLGKYKRDVGNRRPLRMLIHQRAKILKYLKRKDYGRYQNVLGRLALHPESVEGELVV